MKEINHREREGQGRRRRSTPARRETEKSAREESSKKRGAEPSTLRKMDSPGGSKNVGRKGMNEKGGFT